MTGHSISRSILSRRWLLTLCQTLVGVAIIGVWQGVITFNIVSRFELTPPSGVARQIGHWLRVGVQSSTANTRSLWTEIGATLEVAALGLAIAMIVGTVIGLSSAIVPIIKAFLSPFLGFVNAVPLIVVIPVFVFWLGFGNKPIVLLIAITQTFLIAAVVEGAAREIQGVMVQHARSLGATWAQMVKTVYLPGTVIWVVSVLRQCVGHSIVAAIVFEFFGATSGLGAVIRTAQGNGQAVDVYAGVAVAAIVACGIDIGLRVVDTRVGRYLPQR